MACNVIQIVKTINIYLQIFKHIAATIYHAAFLRHVMCFCKTERPFYQLGLTLTPAWISYDIHYNVWGEITHPIGNFNGAAVEVWEGMNNFIWHFTGHVITYSCCQ